MKQLFQSVFFLLLAGMLVAGCGPSNKMTGSWVDNSYAGKGFQGKVLVIGVARNQTHRRIFEDSLTANLREAGVDAVASHTVEAEPIKAEEAAIRAVVAKAGASEVMVTHVTGSDEESRYFPAVGATIVDTGYYGGLYRYYPQVYHFVYMPAQNTTTETVTLETGLYDVADGKLIWIGRTKAVNPEMTKKYYQSLTKLFVRDLKTKKLI